jgi:hypothetical protein
MNLPPELEGGADLINFILSCNTQKSGNPVLSGINEFKFSRAVYLKKLSEFPDINFEYEHGFLKSIAALAVKFELMLAYRNDPLEEIRLFRQFCQLSGWPADWIIKSSNFEPVTEDRRMVPLRTFCVENLFLALNEASIEVVKLVSQPGEWRSNHLGIGVKTLKDWAFIEYFVDFIYDEHSWSQFDFNKLPMNIRHDFLNYLANSVNDHSFFNEIMTDWLDEIKRKDKIFVLNLNSKSLSFNSTGPSLALSPMQSRILQALEKSCKTFDELSIELGSTDASIKKEKALLNKEAEKVLGTMIISSLSSPGTKVIKNTLTYSMRYI